MKIDTILRMHTYLRICKIRRLCLAIPTDTIIEWPTEALSKVENANNEPDKALKTMHIKM